MKSEEFIRAAARTDLQSYKAVADRLQVEAVLRILHASMGLVTESGELMDALKKHLMYGKPLDIPNLVEEAGDLEWYMALLLRALLRTHDSIFEINIAKLQARYPEKFTEFDALNRDLSAERRILEDGEATPERS